MTISVSRSKKTNRQYKNRSSVNYKYEIKTTESTTSTNSVEKYFIHLTGLKSTKKDSMNTTKNDLTDWYNNFISTQTEIINNNKLFTSAGAPNDLTRVFKKRRVVQQKYITYVKSIDDLNSVEILDSICSVATSTFELLENIAANHKVTNF